MSLPSPGIQLKKEDQKRRLDLDKCVLCQKVTDNKGDKKLTSTANGRELLFEASEIPEDRKDNVKYHVNTCYSRKYT